MAFPADYTLLQKITIDKDKVSGSANLTDFSMLTTMVAIAIIPDDYSPHSSNFILELE